MRKRALVMALKSVAMAVAILGVPLAVVGPAYVWQSTLEELQEEAHSIGRMLDRESPTPSRKALDYWLGAQRDSKQIRIITVDGQTLEIGAPQSAPTIEQTIISTNGATVHIEVSAWTMIFHIVLIIIFVAAGCCAAGLGAWVIARRESRRLAAPLIYLAAQAEQVGSGMVQPQLTPSGIEEIDLVQEELMRSNQRLAGRIAKERQFAADASHQLRTPMTALSMRIEEIQLMSEEPHIQHEAEECLEQVDRLTSIIDALLSASRRREQETTTQAISIEQVFEQQKEEWQSHFDKVGRNLVFDNKLHRAIVATPSSLSQALATLIENSLKYGEGTVTVKTGAETSKRSLFIDVSDQGRGMTEEQVDKVFQRGYSTHGSTGIGLALAKDLIEADGGWIRVEQASPPIFRIGLSAIPSSMKPEKMIPKGSIVSVGRRGRSF
ncbi:MAG: HAMP domain-containing sensor histidine kinase [Actinomycetaceae bacterium]|nr:HAMP domain-containing sensor histidine kinase [Actinomycetaceae bacterium]